MIVHNLCMYMCICIYDDGILLFLQKSSQDELKQQLAKVFEEKHKSELASKVSCGAHIIGGGSYQYRKYMCTVSYICACTVLLCRVDLGVLSWRLHCTCTR